MGGRPLVQGSRRYWVALAIAALVTLPAGTVRAFVDPPDPVDPAVSAEQRLGANARARDQIANPALLTLLATDCFGVTNDDAACGADPFRDPARWAEARGTHQEVAFANRYGATLRGDLYVPRIPFEDPVTGKLSAGPFPVVLFLPGLDAARTGYRGAPQSLAESGYITLSFDPQGYGESDADPAPEFCDPDGSWTQPQEMGFVENGPCAGQSSGSVDDVVVGQVVALTLDDWEAVQRVYVDASPQLVFGALDAIAWLHSDESPVEGIVDTMRAAIAGHSLGAYASMMVANGDPHERFLAGVGWDGYGLMDHGVLPRVPTLFLQSQQENVFGPRVVAPDPHGLHPTRTTHATFEAACVPSEFVVLGASTHGEWGFVPFAEASRLGERVSFYHTLAWFDAFVKGAETGIVRGDEAAQRDDGLARLRAATFDASADRSSIGAGLYDAATNSNVPYTIEGLAVEDQLSPYFTSEREPGIACAPP